MEVAIGSTMQGAFVVKRRDNSLETLVDKHVIVLAIDEKKGEALVAYTGTFEPHHKHLRYVVLVDKTANKAAGWKESEQFYVDCTKLCSVPLSKLTPRGRVSRTLLAKVGAAAAEARMKNLVSITRYADGLHERVTGVIRAEKKAMAAYA